MKQRRNHKIITEFAKHITESMNELIEAGTILISHLNKYTSKKEIVL